MISYLENLMKNVNENEKPHLKLLNQYIKDLSYENVIGLKNVIDKNKEKNTSIDISLNYHSFDENRFGVIIKINCHGKQIPGETNLFHLELDYFGSFMVDNISKYSSEILTKEGARIIFPFARTIIATVTQNGGINPVFLDNIDFGLLKS